MSAPLKLSGTVGGASLRTKPYFATFDRSAEVWEIFRDKDCDSYIGCADTLEEAEQVAREHQQEE